MKIPFNKIYFTGKEKEYINQALEKASIVGDGYFNKKVVNLLEKTLEVPKVLTTSSGTHALELAILLIDIKPGDEVILPSFTFTSTANAIILFGGKPIFVDIDKESLAIKAKTIERAITDKTRAIIPVHYGGIGCNMDEIMTLAKKHRLYVVEDAAQVLGGKYLGKPLGTWGHIGCYSFHGTKNFISGEGGAVSINSGDPQLIERAEIIRQKGTNRNRFLKGEVDKYSWVDIGSSYVPSDILMALLYSQLLEMENITRKREAIVENYMKKLKPLLDRGKIISMTNIPKAFRSNYHNFYIRLKDETTRDKLIEGLKERGIQSVIHYVPLHSSLMGQKLGYRPLDLPITEGIGKTLLRLPLYTAMTIEENDYVVENLYELLA